MREQELRELMAQFGGLRITVAGDLFLDRWWEVDQSLQERWRQDFRPARSPAGG